MRPITRVKHLLPLLLIAPLLANPFNASSQEKPALNIDIKSLVDSLSLSISRYYVLPEKARLIAEHLQSQYKKHVYSPATDPAKLARQIQDDIASVHLDHHFKVGYEPQLILKRNGQPKPTEEELKQVYAGLKEENYLFRRVENLPCNIGYLRFDGFAENLPEVRTVIFSALQFLANSRALIIDLRNNGGGSPKTVTDIESFFFKHKTHMNSFVDHTGKDTTRYYTDPAKAGLNLTMPIYILTGRRTFSGAEIFAYDMQNARRAIIVGEKTAMEALILIKGLMLLSKGLVNAVSRLPADRRPAYLH